MGWRHCIRNDSRCDLRLVRRGNVDILGGGYATSGISATARALGMGGGGVVLFIGKEIH